jgi:iron complex transport system substrate-binding protein
MELPVYNLCSPVRAGTGTEGGGPPAGRRRARRITAVLAAAATLVLTAAACGGDDRDGAVSGPSHVVNHSMGSTRVSDAPKRVVVLDTPELDAALTLGITPVGAVRDETSAGLSSYLGDRTRGIKVVGIIGEPSLEAIAALDPDLILSSKDRDESRYTQLSAIAPTVFGAAPGARWKQNFLLYADALGKAADGRAKLAGYEKRAHDIGARLGDPAKTTVSVVRFLPDETRLYTAASYSGTILADIGVARPAAVRDAKDIAVNISTEQLGRADATIVYATFYGPRAGTTFAAAGPLWAKVPAVAAGRVHYVDDSIWMTGIGITGASLVLDDLARTLPAA